MPGRLWDCFMFFNELDMLQCRLEEAEDLPVYRHVLVEAAVDHRGHPKPLLYADNRERFAAWQDRIIHVVATGLASVRDAPDPWVREHQQRDRGGPALAAAGARPEDLVLISDLDEIPSPRALLPHPSYPVALDQAQHLWAVDWQLPKTLLTSVIGRYRDIVALGQYRDTVLRARYGDAPGVRIVRDGGRHFTSLGGPDAIAAKMNAHCHLEDVDTIARNAGTYYRTGAHHLGAFCPQPQDPVNVDTTWPRYIYGRRCPPSWFRPRDGDG